MTASVCYSHSLMLLQSSERQNKFLLRVDQRESSTCHAVSQHPLSYMTSLLGRGEMNLSRNQNKDSAQNVVGNRVAEVTCVPGIGEQKKVVAIREGPGGAPCCDEALRYADAMYIEAHVNHCRLDLSKDVVVRGTSAV
ncbi:hypothetical protein Tco_0694446 [Tanacetum coccineum]